ncbi:hypothetical protein [Mesotoga sp.]|uniref:hypothetical protein n=1 Tax=Mesotoga sp. TaxID=2053577 RepID=UPI001BD2D302|nr:hypothetical protein [Mesotoga sp.]
MQFESNLSEYFRKGNEVSKEVEAFEERYGGSSFLLKVVDSNQPGGVLTPAFIDTLNDLESSLEGFNILSKTSTFANLIESFYSGLPTQVQPNLLRGTIAGTVIQGSVSQDSSRAAIHTYIRNTNARDISRTLVRVENGLREILPAEFSVTLKGTPPYYSASHGQFLQKPGDQSRILGSGRMVACIAHVFFSPGGISGHATLFFAVTFSLGTMGILGVSLDAATVLVESISVGV